MQVASIISAKEDESFVERVLVPRLSVLGFDFVRTMAESGDPGGSDFCVAVVSEGLRRSKELWTAAERAVQGSIPVIVIQRDRLLDTAETPLASGLRVVIPYSGPTAVASSEWDLFMDLVPPLSERMASHSSIGAESLDWNASAFSEFLERAVGAYRYHRCERLLDLFDRHVQTRGESYDVTQAKRDLGALRKKRHFRFMQRYAEAVERTGVRDLQVRRQHAQACIELKHFETAVELLRAIVKEAPADHAERDEARGLLGRAFKQQYVDAPNAPHTPELLTRAIKEYLSAFVDNNENTWHGVNAASLLRRQRRDGMSNTEALDSGEIAERVLEVLDTRAMKRSDGSGSRLDVWDCASRVEALIALDRYDDAGAALDVYLAHPDMNAFEVSSTHRQFDEVLGLQHDTRGKGLFESLTKAVERFRSPVRSQTPGAETGEVSMLIRVADPAWEPEGIPDLVIHSRLGTVIAITGSRQSVSALLRDPMVISLEESRTAGPPECTRSMPFVRRSATYGEPPNTFAEQGADVLIAVIDDGIDILHRAFLDDHGRSRVVGIWDQRDSISSLKLGPPPGFTFGTYYSAATVQSFVAANSVPEELGRNVDGHGTHVTSIAAGRAVGGFAGGVASAAKLLMVIASGKESIGYSASHLSALTFIEQQAAHLELPVVVNVSQGMNAGAHDGKSALEVAFNDFSAGGRKPGRVIVKSAGNERDTSGHARVSMLSNSKRRLRWKTEAGRHFGGDRIEVWMASGNEYRFRLQAPGGQQSDWVGVDNPTSRLLIAGGPEATLEFDIRHVDNGESRLLIEIGDGYSFLLPGEWVLDIVSGFTQQQQDIHAWIERSSNPPSQFTKFAYEDVTLSIPGTASDVIAVAAVDAEEPIEVSEFSSHGPTRTGDQKPDVAAPGVNIEAARGGTVDQCVVMCGTSMAAPHVAGAIALVLSKANSSKQSWPTSSQVRAALRRSTRNYSGYWEPGQGWGVIDIQKLLAARF